MQIEIISIGDELLIGQTVNTNAAWIGEQLSLAGFGVKAVTTIRDEKEEINTALNYAFSRAGIVLITGGLGPTKDDITKHVLAEYFNTRLVRNEAVLTHIESFFSQRGRVMLDANIRQADLPENCTILHNPVGTAAGMWFENNGKICISMPGVPYEMKAIMELEVLPKLKEKFQSKVHFHRTVLTQGIGESFLAEKIKDWETDLRNEGMGLAYLPSPGLVRLRISASEDKKSLAEEKVNGKIETVLPLISKYVYGFDEDKLESVIGRLLLQKKATLSTAESCTGGNIAHLITEVPGSSDYFQGSVVSYSNEIKIKELGVNPDDLKTFGAVSQQVAEQMARGINQRFRTDYSIAVSGVAGPAGGTEEKPVGTVWIAVAEGQKVYSKKYLFEKDRQRNITRSTLTALMMLRGLLLGDPENK